MEINAVTRRSFLETSAGLLATFTAAGMHSAAHAKSPLKTAGAVYGRVGKRGISAGTSAAPSLGEVILLDGTVVKATHGSGQHIIAGKSVLLAADASGGWSVVYAEV
jgi:hypothetical protein